MRGAVPSLPNTPSWRGAQLKNTGANIPYFYDDDDDDDNNNNNNNNNNSFRSRLCTFATRGGPYRFYVN
jgi:hypothetical protein